MNAAVSLGEVLARPDVWLGDRLASNTLPALSSGYSQLDAELPGGGWQRGALTEILSDGVGLGECSLLLPILDSMREEGKWSLLVAPPHLPHGQAWTAGGSDLARLVVASPARQRDALWAAEQALTSGALGTVLCWAKHADTRQIRRLQVAAAGSRTLAFLFRPSQAQKESSAASLRLLLSPGHRGALAVRLIKRRGPPCSRVLNLDVPRPVKWREEHEPSVARSPSAVSPARSQRHIVVA